MSEAAERIVLAGLLRAPDLNTLPLRRVLNESDFAWQVHGWLFAQCGSLWRETKAVPLPLDVVYRRMRASSFWRDFGPRPVEWLVVLYDADPTGAWCVNKARLVLDLAERRRTIHAANIRIRDAMELPAEVRLKRKKLIGSGPLAHRATAKGWQRAHNAGDGTPATCDR